jgi:hypothetical protein
MRHTADVAASAEPLAVAGQHHGAHPPVARNGVQRLDQFGTHFIGDGVTFFRTIQRDHGDLRVDSDLNGGCAHACLDG